MALQDVLLAPVRNRLLAALPVQVFAKLWPHLESVELLSGQELIPCGRPVPAVYFPETVSAAVLIRLADGTITETSLVGREGMIGVSLLSGSAAGMMGAVVRTSGTMLRMNAVAFGQALDHVPGLLRFLVRYAVAFQEQALHDMACAGHYPPGQRLAYRLLMLHDHHECDELPVTVEALASMLNIDLAALARELWRFQQAGLVGRRQGQLTILDRKGLQEGACGCYEAMQRRFTDLLDQSANFPWTV